MSGIATFPSWSPTGDRLIYNRFGGAWELDLTTRIATELFEPHFESLTYSPDGSRILAVKASLGCLSVWQGLEVTELTPSVPINPT